MSKVKVYWM